MEPNYICVDSDGNQLLSIVAISEKALSANEHFTHCLAIVKAGNDSLLGWNKWRSRYEIFGGCVEKNESPKECIVRECYEELGIENGDFTYLGAMKLLLKPDYFSTCERIEYGGLYGLTIQNMNIDDIYEKIKDREEITKLAFYSEIKGKEPIAVIDEALLRYY